MATSPSLADLPISLGPPPTFVDRPVLRFTVEQYHQMIAAGLFPEDLRVELFEGAIVHMTPVGSTHRGSVVTLLALLSKLVDGCGWHACSQQPTTLSNSEPEPDLSIVRGSPQDYFKRHPSPSDLALVVEVADSSPAFDRGPKAKLYAAAGIPEYWIVNLIDGQVEVHTNPRPVQGEGPTTYTEMKIYSATDRVPVSLLGKPLGEVPAAEFLP
jgi:Uma2 family endonuclease